MDFETLVAIPTGDWPDEAEEVLMAVLTDRSADPEDRLLAAELAGDLMVADDDTARALLALLRDPSEADELRGQAAISLGPQLETFDFDWPDDELETPILTAPVAEIIRRTLHAVYLDPETPSLVRRRALEAAVRGADTWYEGAVRAAFHSGDPDWRLTAVFCMKYVEGFDEEIVSALGDDDPGVEVHAIEAAGIWEIDAAWPRLQALVASSTTDKRLLLAAAHAITCIRPEEAFDTLEHLLEAADDDVADTVDEALSMAEVLEEIRFEREGYPLTGPLGNGTPNWDERERDPG